MSSACGTPLTYLCPRIHWINKRRCDWHQDVYIIHSHSTQLAASSTRRCCLTKEWSFCSTSRCLLLTEINGLLLFFLFFLRRDFFADMTQKMVVWYSSCFFYFDLFILFFFFSLFFFLFLFLFRLARKNNPVSHLNDHCSLRPFAWYDLRGWLGVKKQLSIYLSSW